ncbi:MAG: anion permease [Dehalococcoidia bacterium]|nr:anion permease [Dehalococcoidia bacterium]
MLLSLCFLAAIYMGWALGANNTANLFGTGVITGAVKYRTAIILCSVFVILGSLLEGQKVIGIVAFTTELDIKLALLCAITAASLISVWTYLGFPVSTSKTILGTVFGVSLYMDGLSHFPWHNFIRVMVSWVTAPLGGMLISIGLYKLMDIFTRRIKTLPCFTLAMKIGIMVVGSYGGYSMGAGNVANVTGVFVGAGIITPFTATLIGGLAIALGVCTYSRPVMETVGAKIVPLDIPAAFVSILATAIVVHFFAKLGIPVSVSTGIVGAVIGIGVCKGVRTIDKKTVTRIIAIGWVLNFILAVFIPYFLLLLFW